MSQSRMVEGRGGQKRLMDGEEMAGDAGQGWMLGVLPIHERGHDWKVCGDGIKGLKIQLRKVGLTVLWVDSGVGCVQRWAAAAFPAATVPAPETLTTHTLEMLWEWVRVQGAGIRFGV
eukprot:1253962-Rhodomonas_salina.4